METNTQIHTPAADRGGPPFHVNIEGQVFDWDDPTITVPEIRALGSLPPELAVQLIDLQTNEQRTLGEAEIVELRPGLGFSKKVKFVRGS